MWYHEYIVLLFKVQKYILSFLEENDEAIKKSQPLRCGY